MLQHSTQLSGITAGHSVQISDSGAATLCVPSPSRVFAASAKRLSEPLRRTSLCCAFRTFTVRATSSLLFGRDRPSLGTLLSKASARVLFAFAARFTISSASLLADDCLQRRAKVAFPTIAPRGHSYSLERLRPRPACERSRAPEAPPLGRSPASV